MSAAAAAVAPALDDGTRAWSAAELEACVSDFADVLRGVRVLATLLDNSVAWVIADLAASRADIVHVPLPVFFTSEQIGHALRAAGADALLVPAAVAARWPQAPAQPLTVAKEALVLLRLPGSPAVMPKGTSKITFTSGTTGAPKGVCLSASAMDMVARGLVQSDGPTADRAPPLRAAFRGAAGEHRRADGAAAARRDLRGAAVGAAGPERFVRASTLRAFHAAVLRTRPTASSCCRRCCARGSAT